MHIYILFNKITVRISASLMSESADYVMLLTVSIFVGFAFWVYG